MQEPAPVQPSNVRVCNDEQLPSLPSPQNHLMKLMKETLAHSYSVDPTGTVGEFDSDRSAHSDQRLPVSSNKKPPPSLVEVVNYGMIWIIGQDIRVIRVAILKVNMMRWNSSRSFVSFRFQFAQRSPLEKEYVGALFDSIAHRYDLLNHLLSGGIDVYWRHRAIRHLRDSAPKHVLDVATGTGDFALAALEVKPEKVIGIDIAEEMLKRGREKVARKGFQDVVTLQTGEAENLDFESDSFDAAIVAFGARNFEDLEKGLSEMCRIL